MGRLEAKFDPKFSRDLKRLIKRRVNLSALEEVIVTDTIPLSSDPAKDRSKLTVLSMAETFADIIEKVYNYEPISSSFIN